MEVGTNIKIKKENIEEVETNIKIKKKNNGNNNQTEVYIKKEPVEFSDEVSEVYGGFNIKAEKHEVGEEANAIKEIEVPIVNYIHIKLEKKDTDYEVPQSSKFIKLYNTTTHKDPLNNYHQELIPDKPFKCELCDYECFTISNLKEHTKYNHTNERKYLCHLCKYRCTTITDLNKHFLRHSDNKPFVCDYCDYRCRKKFYLKEHIQYRHTKEKNFSCKECDYKCVTKTALTVHLRKHTGEKPYACHLCDYKCSQPGLLRSHMERKDHAKTKKFSCPLCQAKCDTQLKLDEHILNHARDRTFRCDICNIGFSRQVFLNTHNQIEHPSKFSCGICQDECVAQSHIDDRHLRNPTGGKLITYGRKRNVKKE